MRAAAGFIFIAIALAGCQADLIRDRPISFSEWRVQETIKYINNRYDRKIDSLEMLPVMIVSHFTAMDSLETSFKYINNEAMESGRGLLKKAGGANIAVQFLVGKKGEIYRLMPEHHIGRHVIGLNRHAIGIENVGANEQSLTLAQIEANAYIVRHLARKFPIRYLIGHSEYRSFEQTPLWEEKDNKYRTDKVDPGESFMRRLRAQVADLDLKSVYDGGEIPARLEYLLSQYQDKGEFNGNVLVIRNGEVIFRKSFGVTAGKEGRPLTPEDPLYLASAAKPFTASAVAQLEAKKLLSYTTPVAPFFPELRHLLKDVQVRHLLSHTSGLEDYYKLVKAAPGFSNADALAAIAKQLKPLFRPGKKFYYANSNYVLLAEIVARTAGKDFAAYIAENIFTPAQMAASFFTAQAKAAVKPVAATDAAGNEFQYGYKTSGPGGVYATLDDLARFDTALLKNQLLSAEQFKKLIRPEIKVTAKETQYGLGWYVYPKRDIIYHDGNFGGYHAMNWLQLKGKNAIVLLANRSTNKIKEITYEIDRIMNGLKAAKMK